MKDARTITLRFRVTPDEEQALKLRCQRADLSLSDFIRLRVIEAPTRQYPQTVATTRRPGTSTRPLCPRCTRIGTPACTACQTGG